MRGADVDWTPLYVPVASRARVDLPTYAFQHERYWPRPGVGGTGDVHATGLSPAEHPLFGAAVALADMDGYLFTGRLSSRPTRGSRATPSAARSCCPPRPSSNSPCTPGTASAARTWRS
ncbi:hypothetical protein SMD44_07601 [Streptomyces alboflavus]|uniref:Uncharacterized protein n=1 Tax=Streptomyces alboflavus TaxID=67267 RepID=A0A1Z1WNV2_9ACTN|nr:hypothetical protein SMD44_07601 [Streptomyces alboflavus]